MMQFDEKLLNVPWCKSMHDGAFVYFYTPSTTLPRLNLVIDAISSAFFYNFALHSGQVIKWGGDKTVPIDRNEWKFGIFSPSDHSM